MKITQDLLRAKSACADGVAWFGTRFGDESDYQVVLDALAQDGHVDWARWLIEAIGPTHDVLEVGGAPLASAHLFVAGELWVTGQLVVRGALIVAGGIEAGEDITAAGEIKAGLDVMTGYSISCERLALRRVFAGLCARRPEEQEIRCATIDGTVAFGTMVGGGVPLALGPEEE